MRNNLANHFLLRAGLKSYGRLWVKSTDRLDGDLVGAGTCSEVIPAAGKFFSSPKEAMTL
jgi:hypothetical protein